MGYKFYRNLNRFNIVSQTVSKCFYIVQMVLPMSTLESCLITSPTLPPYCDFQAITDFCLTLPLTHTILVSLNALPTYWSMKILPDCFLGQVYYLVLLYILYIPIIALISLYFAYMFTGLWSWRVGTVSYSTLYAQGFKPSAYLKVGFWHMNGWMIYWIFQKSYVLEVL